MKVLVTGSLGYIGSVLVETLAAKGISVQGVDSGLYRNATLEQTPFDSHTEVVDIRQIESKHVEGVDAVVHLAALSNDPLGELSSSLTRQINFEASRRLAEIAKSEGVKRFVFVSTQSIYGKSDEKSGDLDEIDSIKNPITEYAKSKYDAERALEELHSPEFFCVSLRPATVFGYSPRLRTDIVFNNFVAQAFFNRVIRLSSDGQPWRPVVHVQDVCNAVLLALELAPEMLVSRVYNVGIKGGNSKVMDLAKAAQRLIPGSEIVVSELATPDERSYQVSFSRIYKELGFRPKWDLDNGGKHLIDKWNQLGFTAEDFRSGKCVRLDHLSKRREEGSLDEHLYSA